METILKQIADNEYYKPHDLLMWIDEIIKMANDKDEVVQFDFMDFLISEARYNGIKRLDKSEYFDEFENYSKFIDYLEKYENIVFNNPDMSYKVWHMSLTGDYEGVDEKTLISIYRTIYRLDKEG